MIVPNLCFFSLPDKGGLKVSNLFVSIFVFLSFKVSSQWNVIWNLIQKHTCFQNYQIVFFGNPKEFPCFIPSMVQNIRLSTKMRIKSKWIKWNWIQKYERRLLGLKNVWPQCLSSKGEGVFGKMDSRNWNCKWKRGD